MEMPNSLTHKLAAPILFIFTLALGPGFVLAGEGPERTPNDSGTPQASKAATPEKKAASSDALQALEAKVAQQQAQIERLTRALELLNQRLNETSKPPAAAPPNSVGPVASLTAVIPAAVAKPGNIAEATSPSPGSGQAAPATQIESKSAITKAPLTLSIGDVDLTLAGFVDATGFFRSTNLGSGIGSSFGGLPFSNTSTGLLTETRFTAQNSRVSLMATSVVHNTAVKGYLESDFLGTQPTNAFVTSNSQTARLRLYWVQLIRGKFEILGGQSWSMLTPNRTGLSPMPGDIFYTQDMDTNYQVGLTWSRNNQFRFIYHPSKEWAMGVSLENPQQFVGTATLPPNFPASEVEQGTNTATPNLHPDIIAKVAYDPMVSGKHMHVEVAGLVSSFRTVNAALNTKTSATGGGGSLNLNLEAVKKLHLMFTSFYSDGGGRWIGGVGPDLIIKADGSPSLVHGSSAIGGFEYQANPNTLIYGYYGGAYFQRNTGIFIDPKTGKASLIGFGYKGSPNSQNKSLQEATWGFIQTFWQNPRYGKLQLITQYSYLTRAPWFVATGNPKNAHLSMGYVNLRYVLP
jgi:uncharacterized coiled-coil protein SlyX